jgi:Protein of unknown function (DUF2809)
MFGITAAGEYPSIATKIIAVSSMDWIGYSGWKCGIILTSSGCNRNLETMIATFNLRYFYWTVLLLVTEICIAVFIHEQFIRPFFGDVLVVILIYCLIKTFWNIRVGVASLSVFAFACTIEVLQYFNLVGLLGLQKYQLLVIILGSTFDWNDILAYAIGTAVILWLEK